ncbi:hypothetical protein ACFO1B_30905 [Dactylosporangium siamense]|uniref:hypothetical protein n=1 Tax=Dactylosporangium siamense TaxID=685454 RepID=UPI0019416D32|nr:hypothetical protein [Dactylosporangium siamense]
MSSAGWRVLNALERLGRHPARMATLANAQDAADDDIVRLEQAGLLYGSMYGRTTAVSIGEHLAHDGSPMMIQLRLTKAGARQLSTPRNRVLCLLGARQGRSLKLRFLLTNCAGADVVLFQQMTSLQLVTVAHVVASEPLDPMMLPHVPPSNVAVRLTAKGRTFLPY